MNKPKMPDEVVQFFKKTGSQGGTARAKKHSKEQLSEWGKLGGRPKGSTKKPRKTGGK